MKSTLIVILLFFSCMSVATDTPGHQFTRYAGFQLGEITLADVTNQLGPAQRHHKGDAGDSETWVCYRTSFGEAQFNSGEIGGGTDLIGFTLSNKPLTSACSELSQALVPQIANLRLGMSKPQFVTAVGEPVEWKKQSGAVSFAYPTPDGYDVTVTVIASFDRKGLAKLVVWKIETN